MTTLRESLESGLQELRTMRDEIRLQLHLAKGQPIVKALEHAILEVGMATIFTAITLINQTNGNTGVQE